MSKPHSYSSAYQELEAILEALNSGDVAIDQLPKNLRRAALLLQYCQDTLRGIESELDELFDEEE